MNYCETKQNQKKKWRETHLQIQLLHFTITFKIEKGEKKTKKC